MCGQTTGATPLYIASQNGHVEAVRALVELGAAVNQATVGLLEVSFWAGSVYPLDGLWFVGVSVVVGPWYGSVYGVWWWTREVRRARCCVRTRGCVGGCVCGVRGDAWEDEEGDDERW